MSKGASNKRILQTLWEFTKPHRKWVYLVVFSIASASIVELIPPLVAKELFDILAEPSSDLGVSIALKLIGYIGLGYLISWFFYRVAMWSAITMQAKTMVDIAVKCEAYLLKHSYTFFSNNFAGSLVRKLNRLPRAFERLGDQTQFDYIPLIVSVVGSTIILGWRNIYLGAALLAWIVVFLTFNFLFARWKQKYEVELAEKDSESTGELSDQITNNDNVRLFATHNYETSRYKSINEKVRKLRVFVWGVGDVIDGIQVLLIIGIEVGLFAIAVHLWNAGQLTVGDFALIQGLLIDVFNRVWRFGRVVRDTYTALADAAEMVEILDTPHQVTNSKSAKKLHVKHGQINYQSVYFSFHKTRRILKDFNLNIAAGEHVAFVGPSGAGKSTVVKLLFRLFDLGHGRVLIDGHNIAKVTQDSLRENIALVPQEPILFHRSLMENIRYGNRKATDKEVIKAAKQAHCHEFISSLPDGYETFVGERGIKLSGGERQRVAIARAFLKNAPILVLDEATSSLDSESEALIQDALNKLMEGRTTLVIAHRLSTIMNMDRIIVIEDGGITADGTHQDLLKKSDTYKKLWEIQAGGFLP